MAKLSTQAPSGVVSSLQGRAQVIRQGQETAEALRVGDTLMPGDRLVGSADASLQIAESADANAKVWTLAFEGAAAAGKGKAAAKPTANSAEGKSLDDVIGTIERGDEEDATAAGLTGGDGAAMGEGLRVERIVEVVTPQSFAASSNNDGLDGSLKSTTLLDDANQAPAFVGGGAGDFDPITGNYRFITDEDTPVSGQVSASDADGDALVFAKGSEPANGTVVVNADGSWTYTPNKDFNGPDLFTVTVSDGKGGTATSTVNIGVTPANDPPKFEDPSNPNYDPVTGNYKATTPEDTPVSGTVKAKDTDGDALTFAKGTDPKNGTVTVDANGNWTYTPSKDYNGSDSFTITVSDGKGGTATSTVNIGVTPANDPPKFEDPSNPNYDPVTGNYKATTPEDTPVSGTVKAKDTDGDALTFAKGTDPKNGTVTVDANGNWTYTPSKDYNGSDSFTITVSDGKGGTATSTVNIGVTPANDPPKFEDPSNPNYDPVTGNYKATTPEDTPVSGTVKAKDTDGDALTFAKGTDPKNGTVTVDANGNWTYTPSKDYNGSDSFTITVSDGKGGTATSTVNIGVTPANDPPKFEDPSNPNYDPVTGNYKATTPEDTPVSGTVKAKDADGDALTFAKGTDPKNGTVAVDANGNWTYTPSKDYNGSDSFTITVSDGKGGTATSTVNIGVTPANDPPKFEDPSNPNYDPVTGNYKATTPEDTPVSGTVKAKDTDGDALTFAKGTDPKNGTVTVDANGNWTYTPSKDYNGSDSFTITVSDGKGGTATSTVNIGVTPANDPPKFEDPSNPNYDPVTGNYKATTPEDTPVSGTVKAKDTDGDALTFAKGTDPKNGTVTVDAQGNWTYTPSKDYNGSDSFTITVSDGKGGTATSTVNIGVTPANDPPKFEDPSNPNYDPVTGNYKATTPEDTPVSGTVKAKDADGDALTFAKGTDPKNGTVTVDANGNWTYTPSKDYNGSDSFTITVSDGKGGTATSTVNIGVTPANDPPKFEDPSNPNYDPVTGNYKATTPEDTPVSGTVKAKDTDGDALTFAKGTDPKNGTVTVDAQGNWTYTPSKDYNGSDSFTITVSDGKGGTATSTVNIGVTPANDPPKFEDPSNPNYDPVTGNYKATTPEDTPVSGTVKAKDADGDALTFAKGTDPKNGTVTVDANGNWTYTPSKDYNDSDSFTITVSDGKGGTATSTVNIGVTPVNDAPVISAAGSASIDEANLISATAGTSTTGKLAITDVDTSRFDIQLSAPAGNWTSKGAAITWSGGTAGAPLLGTAGGKEVVRVTIDDQGQYKVTLSQSIDHPTASGANTSTLSFGVKVGDGTSTASTSLNVNVLDDVPNTTTSTEHVAVQHDVIRVQGLQVSFANDTYANGTGTVSRTNTDADAGIDRLRWGSGGTTGQQSGYDLVDNSTLASSSGTVVEASQVFKLADFTHSNFGIYSNSSTLTGTDINMSLVVNINGVATTVTFKTKLTHTETANSNDAAASADIITLQSQTATVTVDGTRYKINLLGFQDASGKLVNTIYTNEQASNTFGIYGSIVSADTLPTVQGKLDTSDVSADGISQVIWDNVSSPYGTFVGKSDGSYTFEVNRATREQLDPGETRTQKVTYTLVDGDGDRVTGELNIAMDDYNHIEGTNNTNTLTGTAGNDHVDGMAGNDTLSGDSGHDILVGGKGDDRLTGGDGSDVFAWHLGDAGAKGQPAVDVITDFNTAAASNNGDVLDLRDLLQGETQDNLLQYLDFDTTSTPGSTHIRISTTGGFTDTASDSGAEDQRITLSNVDLRASLGLDAQASDHQIINELMQRGKLLVDQA